MAHPVIRFLTTPENRIGDYPNVLTPPPSAAQRFNLHAENYDPAR